MSPAPSLPTAPQTEYIEFREMITFEEACNRLGDDPHTVNRRAVANHIMLQDIGIVGHEYNGPKAPTRILGRLRDEGRNSCTELLRTPMKNGVPEDRAV